MIKASVQGSVQSDPYEAGKESARRAMAALGDSPGLAIVYCTVGYDEARFVAGVTDAIGGVPLLGATSFTGVLTPEGFLAGESGAGAVMLLSAKDGRFGVGSSEIGADPESAGEAAARAAVAQAGKTADDPASAFLMASPPGAEERLIRGIERVLGRAPMMGGSSADNTLEGKWKQFSNGKVFSNAVAVGVVYGPSKVGVSYTGTYRSTGRAGIITRVRDRRTLVEIDGKPALAVYAEWRGLSHDDLLGGKLLAATIEHPLGIRDVSSGHWWIRHPMNGNHDGTMAIGNDLTEGSAVNLMEASLDEIAAGASESARAAVQSLSGPPAAVIMAHCGGRALGLGPARMQEVATNLKAALGETPFIGYCTFGEQGFASGTANGAGGLMLATMALPSL